MRRIEIADLKSDAEGVSRQLRAWADSLQNSDIKGQRYLNEKEQIIAKGKKERAEFIKTLKTYQNR